MYGYSWLKPAGCTKTMLGRREEEIEREEVERQLREVEMQDRIAVEADEEERQRRMREVVERGEAEFGERDLDDEVPDADAEPGQRVEEEGMDGDLDDDVPDPDEDEDEEDEEADGDASAAFGEGWTYDSRREPDSDEDEDVHQRLPPGPGQVPHLLTQQHRQRGVHRADIARAAAALGVGRARDSDYGYDVDEREAAALADAMLDEDELGGAGFDQEPIEDDIMGGDLDDDVPDADEGGWEHTDTELEESEMDISILPGAPAAPAGRPRRSSGFPLPPSSSRRTSARHAAQARGARVVSGNTAHQLQSHHPGMQMRTPVADQAGALLTSSAMADSQASASALATSDNEAAYGQNQGTRRNWLDAASARRNLFGGSRIGRVPSGTAGGAGLFTPSPRQEAEESAEVEDRVAGQGEGLAQGQRRRRSERVLDGIGTGRGRGENRESLD